jgi:hypothetical protein
MDSIAITIQSDFQKEERNFIGRVYNRLKKSGDVLPTTSTNDTRKCLDYDFNKVNFIQNQKNKKLSLIHPDTVIYSSSEYCDMV